MSLEYTAKMFANVILDRIEPFDSIDYKISYHLNDDESTKAILISIVYNDKTDAFFIAYILDGEIRSLYFNSARIIKVLTKGPFYEIPPKYKQLKDDILANID